MRDISAIPVSRREDLKKKVNPRKVDHCAKLVFGAREQREILRTESELCRAGTESFFHETNTDSYFRARFTSKNKIFPPRYLEPKFLS